MIASSLQVQEFNPHSVHIFCCCAHWFQIIWFPGQISFICTNEPLQGQVFNEKHLCTTPIHILICTNTSVIDKSSIWIHICLFSYQIQFCAIIYGSKTNMCEFYSNLGPKLYAECFHYILMNRNMKVHLISWEESYVCVIRSLVTNTIFNSSFVLYLCELWKQKYVDYIPFQTQKWTEEVSTRF